MKRVIYRSLLGFILVINALVLTGCQQPVPPMVSREPHPLTPYQRSLVSKIRASGAQVIKRGEVLAIVMPTDTFFRQGTTRLKQGKMYALRHIATLVKSYIAPYRYPRVNVMGYTDKVFTRMTRKKISRQYARQVASYLSHRGISAQRIHVRGMGAASPIASNRTVRGSSYNRRVVISLN